MIYPLTVGTMESTTTGQALRWKVQKMPTVEQCKAYAAEYKILGMEGTNSARRSTVLLGISRSWTALAHQFENLAIIAKSEN
jgi:hypothetical protein